MPAPLIVASTPLLRLPTVECSVDRWVKHILARHAEMEGKEAIVEQTLTNPTFITGGNSGTQNVVFVNHDQMSPQSEAPLVVVVNEPGAFVCTALYDRRFRIVAPEDRIWQR